MNYPYIYLCYVVIALPMMMLNLKPAIAHKSVSFAAEFQPKKPIDNYQNNQDNKDGREGFPDALVGGGTR